MALMCRMLLLFFALLFGFYDESLAFDSAEEYFEQWKNTPYNRLVPFGADYFDTVKVGSSSFDLDIHFSFPFYGRTYKTAHVIHQGAIVLGELHESELSPVTKFPNQDYDGTDVHPDPTMFAVYYADAESPKNPASINHRIVDPELETADTVEYDIANLMLRHIRHDVKWAMLGAEHFHPTVAIVVTWHDTTFVCIDFGQCPTNTFQAVIATDGNETYTIYNYHELTWENSIQAGCDLLTGKTSEAYPDCFSAQVGFNAGQGREFFPLPYSNTEAVTYLDQMASHQGRYVYEVSTEVIRRGECLKLDSLEAEIEPSSWPLTAWPPSLSTTGGEELHISGPCLDESDEVICRFYDEINFPAINVDGLRASCIVPMMLKPGDVTVDLIVNGEQVPLQPARIHFKHPGRHRGHVHLGDKPKWWELDDSEKTITWDPIRLLPPSYLPVDENVTSADDVLVDIVLYGYKETNLDKPEWSVIHTFSLTEENDGHFSFDPAEHRCDGEVCAWAKVGAIKVVRSGENPDEKHGIFSETFPLQWFITEAMAEEHGSSDWPREMCKAWKDEQEYEDEWTKDLEPCPCLYNQALNDRIWIPDPDCDDFVTIPELPNPCIDQPVASRCYIPASHGNQGQASKCCYNNDGYLMYSGENNAGSFSSTIHPDGMEPFDRPGIVPHWSNWIKDKMPYLLCCKWATNKDQCYDHFLMKRPTPECKNHHPPGHGGSFGDPHFRTLDGTEYTFNPHGEFVLINVLDQQNVPDFRMQARMEVPNWPEMALRSTLTPALNATVITAIVMIEGNINDAPKVEMRLNAPVSKTKVSVLVNEKYISFDDGIRRREFWGQGSESNQRVLILTEGMPDPWSRQFANFTIIFRSGIVVLVDGNSGLLHVNVRLPRQYFKLPRGLYGAWTGEKDKDLINRQGQLVEKLSNEYIHEHFGMSWVVSEGEALFTYHANMRWPQFSDPDFQPAFELSDITLPGPSEEELQALCGDNFVCRFDYMTLDNADLAKDSLETVVWMESIDTLSAYVPACENIVVPSIKSADMSSGYFLPGGEITFTSCQEGYTLRGSSSYTCEEEDGEASWNPSPDVYCKSNREIANENATLAAAIAVPICLAVLIAAILGGVFFMRRRKAQKAPQSNTRNAQNTNRNSDFDTDDKPPGFEQSHLSFLPNPNPMSSVQKDDDIHRSNNSVGSNLSRNSMVLTQELKAARPPRPVSTLPKLTASSRLSYTNPVQLEDGTTVDVPSAPTMEIEEQVQEKGYDNPAVSDEAENQENYVNQIRASQQSLNKVGQYPYAIHGGSPVRASQEDLRNGSVHASREDLKNRSLQASRESLHNVGQYPYKGNETPLLASQEDLQNRSLHASRENLQNRSLHASRENLQNRSLHASRENLQNRSLHASRENLQNRSLHASRESLGNRSSRASQDNLNRLTILASQEDLQGIGENPRVSMEAGPVFTMPPQHRTAPVRGSQENIAAPTMDQNIPDGQQPQDPYQPTYSDA